jgi:lipoprotein signal peptidase
MVRPGLALVVTAVVLAGVDLVHKAVAGPEHFHARSGAYVAFVIVLAAAWATAIVLTRSVPMAVGGGMVTGGAVGNVASLAFWPGVPNPLEADAIAFNLADLFVLAGFVLVAATTLALVRTERTRLRQPLRLR